MNRKNIPPTNKDLLAILQQLPASSQEAIGILLVDLRIIDEQAFRNGGLVACLESLDRELLGLAIEWEQEPNSLKQNALRSQLAARILRSKSKGDRWKTENDTAHEAFDAEFSRRHGQNEWQKNQNSNYEGNAGEQEELGAGDPSTALRILGFVGSGLPTEEDIERNFKRMYALFNPDQFQSFEGGSDKYLRDRLAMVLRRARETAKQESKKPRK